LDLALAFEIFLFFITLPLLPNALNPVFGDIRGEADNAAAISFSDS
jgi:hypothetical protein